MNYYELKIKNTIREALSQALIKERRFLHPYTVAEFIEDNQEFLNNETEKCFEEIERYYGCIYKGE